jgi:predicted lipoprotein with Yx(FWY)xxD motif
MVDRSGMTIYTYDRDQPNRSTCTGRCAQTWRPVVAPPNAAYSQEWTTVTRADGVQQWAYQGRPLYTWARDQQAGDMGGDGMDNGHWHVVRR